MVRGRSDSLNQRPWSSSSVVRNRNRRVGEDPSSSSAFVAPAAEYDYDDSNLDGYTRTMSALRAKVADLRPRGRFGARHSTMASNKKKAEERERARRNEDTHQVRRVEEIDQDRFWMRQNDAFVRTHRRDQSATEHQSRPHHHETVPPYAQDSAYEIAPRSSRNVGKRPTKAHRGNVATRVWEDAPSKKIGKSPQRHSSASKAKIKASYQKGDAVIATLRGRFRDRNAVVTRANFDGTYDVKLDDGRFGKRASVKTLPREKTAADLAAPKESSRFVPGGRARPSSRRSKTREFAPEWNSNSNPKPFSKRRLKPNERLGPAERLWTEDQEGSRRMRGKRITRTATETTGVLVAAREANESNDAPRPSTATCSTSLHGANKAARRPKTTEGSSRNVYSQFRKQYLRGDLPVIVDHGAKRVVLWKKDIRSLDLTKMLPLFMDGLRETAEPYAFLAYAGSCDMLDHGGDAINVAIPHLITPLKRALDTKSRVVVSRALRVVQRLVVATPRSGRALVPYFRQLLPVFNRILLLEGKSKQNLGNGIEYGGSVHESDLHSIVNNTLDLMERHGGRKAYVNIKYMVPTYEAVRLIE